jgi:hypothetical protein
METTQSSEEVRPRYLCQAEKQVALLPANSFSGQAALLLAVLAQHSRAEAQTHRYRWGHAC